MRALQAHIAARQRRFDLLEQRDERGRRAGVADGVEFSFVAARRAVDSQQLLDDWLDVRRKRREQLADKLAAHMSARDAPL